MKNPKVSILIPCLNGEKSIAHSINSMVNQDYKGKIEIIVADGNSIDNTINILKQFQNEKIKNREIILLNNPKKSTAIGRNICLFNATGKYSLNFSSHMFLSQKDIITKFVNELENLPEKIIAVGANPTNPRKENFIQKITSTLFKSVLAGANNLQQNRSNNKKTFVSGLTVGMYRTELLKEQKGFDPKFWVNQDSELHYRLIKKGYKILFIPNIKISQVKRASLKRLVKQMFRYGRAIVLRFYKYPKSIHPFQAGPALFTIYVILTLISLIEFTQLTKLLISGIVLYTIICLISTLIITRNLIYILLSPAFYFIMHLSYGIGTIVGIFKPQITTGDG
jgi:cellulose synthase/poly-beta-1,6-N-acetylglucosamine synthase-like glycosyltransferase